MFLNRNKISKNKSENPLYIENKPEDIFKPLLNRYFWLLCILGSLAVVGSILRVLQQGESWIYLIHISVFITIYIIFVIRHDFPLKILSSSLIFIIIIYAFTNIITFGLTSFGIFLLAFVLLLTSAILGLKIALISSIIVVIGLSIIAVAVCNGYLPMKFDADIYIVSYSAWLTQILFFIFVLPIVIFILHTIQTNLSESLTILSNRSLQMDGINKQLEQEVLLRIRKEKDLKKNEKKYRLLVTNMRDLVFSLDMNLNLIFVSPSIKQIFGYNIEEALKLKISNILDPKSFQRAIKIFKEYINKTEQKNVEFPLLEFVFIKKDGSFFPGELKVDFLKDDNENFTGLQGVLRDVSDRKKAEKEKKTLEEHLGQSKKLESIGQLAGGIAHDFNNQLSGIIGFADLLRIKVRKNKKLSYYADNILLASNRASDLTAQLLAFARKGKYKSIPVNIHSLIHEVVTILLRSIDKTIQIMQHLEANPSITIGDPTQLQNAILNIAINARDAMPNGGELKFSTNNVSLRKEYLPDGEGNIESGEFILLSISDTGIGMDKEIKKHIFEPFFTTKDIEKGTGMGLAAVYGTIQSHNGAINVQSESGHGSVFRIYLPICFEPEDNSENLTTDDYVKGKGSILLVEDEEIVSKMTSAMLENLGYSVIVCSDGAEAIDYYRKSFGKIDVVILDIVLPKIGGKKVFKEMRKVNPESKIILYSGYSPDNEVRKILMEDKTEFIQKPFRLSDISNKLENFIDF